MSSMRNAVQRRPHRERAQPLERRRLGLLEKHKDYSLRAEDYGKKKAQLKSLRQKAADRNEDEFYFGMMSRKGPGSRIMNGKNWNGTVQGDRGNKVLDRDTVRLLKTQDMGYVRTMRQVVSKEVSRLEEQVVLTRGLDRLDEEDDEEDEEDSDEDQIDDGAKLPHPTKQKAPRKIIFTDSAEERSQALRHVEKSDREGEQDRVEELEADDSERAKALRRLKRQLELARKKFKALTDAEQELEIQRAKMAKTATSGGQTKKGRKIMVRRRKR